MAQKDAFDELRKSKEEEYFRKQESELLEQLRQKAAAEAERRKMGEALETQDPQLLEDLQALGYTAETVKLLFAIPLISVAWADGSVSPRERSLIRELAQGGAQKQLTEWLDHRPSEAFVEASLRAIRSLLASKSADAGCDLLASCVRIAEASGGILGLGSISGAERAAMERVAAEIEREHPEASRQVLERL
jgi:Tellurite resistance protein TerB